MTRQLSKGKGVTQTNYIWGLAAQNMNTSDSTLQGAKEKILLCVYLHRCQIVLQ